MADVIQDSNGSTCTKHDMQPHTKHTKHTKHADESATTAATMANQQANALKAVTNANEAIAASGWPAQLFADPEKQVSVACFKMCLALSHRYVHGCNTNTLPISGLMLT
jgi:predicted deacetylase